MVEKEWFDNFLAYKDKGVSGTIAAKPGKINNGKLLLSSKVMNGGASSLDAMSDKVDTDNNNNLEPDERRLRRRKWQGIQERNKEEEEVKTNNELLGGNSQFRPELREGVDYVLVGKETWSFFSSHFSSDVELPTQQLQKQQPTVSLDSIETSNSGSDSKQSEMDDGDAGSSVAVARSASSLISEESGDDLVSFPLHDSSAFG